MAKSENIETEIWHTTFQILRFSDCVILLVVWLFAYFHTTKRITQSEKSENLIFQIDVWFFWLYEESTKRIKTKSCMIIPIFKKKKKEKIIPIFESMAKDNLVLSTRLIMGIGHHKEIQKLICLVL